VRSEPDLWRVTVIAVLLAIALTAILFPALNEIESATLTSTGPNVFDEPLRSPLVTLGAR